MGDFERKLHDARELQRDLRTVFSTHIPGEADEQALEDVRRLCALSALTIDDFGYHRELRELERYAGYLLSEDGRRRWGSRGAGGVERLWDITKELLKALHRRLENLELRRQSARVRAAASEATSSYPRRRLALRTY